MFLKVRTLGNFFLFLGGKNLREVYLEVNPQEKLIPREVCRHSSTRLERWTPRRSLQEGEVNEREKLISS